MAKIRKIYCPRCGYTGCDAESCTVCGFQAVEHIEVSEINKKGVYIIVALVVIAIAFVWFNSTKKASGIQLSPNEPGADKSIELPGYGMFCGGGTMDIIIKNLGKTNIKPVDVALYVDGIRITLGEFDIPVGGGYAILAGYNCGTSCERGQHALKISTISTAIDMFVIC